jgi:hypothetical protein
MTSLPMPSPGMTAIFRGFLLETVWFFRSFPSAPINFRFPFYFDKGSDGLSEIVNSGVDKGYMIFPSVSRKWRVHFTFGQRIPMVMAGLKDS